MGAGLSWALGWPPLAGFVFGLALSVASTVVLIRALQDRHILETQRGRIAVGWLVVEDLAMVLALVLLPALAVATDGKGALGAFFAGMVLGESDLSQRAAEEAIPLRDAFAVLFFVSVGMLLNPMVFVDAPLAVLAIIAIIIVGKSAAAYLIVRAFGHGRSTAFTVSASLAQIGEFSFILIGIGIGLNMVPREARDLVLAGAIVSILANPFVFTLLERLGTDKEAAPGDQPAVPPETDLEPTTLTGHDIVVDYGRVGSLVGAGLACDRGKMIVVEASDEGVERARRHGAEVFTGNAAEPAIISAINLAGARRLYVTIPEAFEAGQIVQQARAANPGLDILARAHADGVVEHLDRLGANLVVSGETEIAHRMLERALREETPAPSDRT
jgi:CPA2 family monovalent cation:H+ antiporter-2